MKTHTRSSRKTAIMLVGLPAAGKSTWAAEFNAANPEFAVLAIDHFIEPLAVEGGYRERKEDAFPHVGRQASHQLWLATKACIDSGNSFIFDRVNGSSARRDLVLSRLDSSWRKVAICFHIPADLCRERMEIRKRTKGIVIDNLEDIISYLDFPESGFDLIVHMDHVGKIISTNPCNKVGNELLRQIFPQSHSIETKQITP